MGNAAFYIHHLNLKPHPEGGFYKETYRSEGIINATFLKDFEEDRSYATAIYYLLEKNDFSAFHRIKSDECWHYYAGDVLHIHILLSDGSYTCIKLGAAINKDETLQFVVPANTWFAAECSEESSFVLTGCTVAPGFDFADFELADKEKLLKNYLHQSQLIERLCR